MRRVYYHSQRRLVLAQLLMDGLVMTGLVVIADWRDVCKQLLRRVLEAIYGARIDMN
ncbi:hypothetical protein Goshw_029275 [Gossypium schwendimanii]|uniref:Uncharacterized protein n=1 Tax=Gossypium schwendimanii TaxID=34291 RepID=A0A7J9LZA0_GOSSC|nr:hypothetical protein [Gossypium schwendimanii]